MANLTLAEGVLNFLKTLKVNTVCLCPGARNSPFVEALSGCDDFEKLNFFDERAAGFFALGRIRSESRPVVVITTSGTAAGELLPAVMEAHYSGRMLIVVTADRPPHYRGTGAPQTAEQVGIFGPYVSYCHDLDLKTLPARLEYSTDQPLHLNVCFDEPLPGRKSGHEITFVPVRSAELRQEKFNEQRVILESFLESFNQVLVIVGGLNSSEAPHVLNFLRLSRLPFYAEAQSGLREKGELVETRLASIDGIIKRAEAVGHSFEAVLRIGDVPTHRLWRDLESKTRLPVLSISSKNFTGLPGSQIIHTNLEVFFSIAVKPAEKLGSKQKTQDLQKLFAEDLLRSEKLTFLLCDEPSSEPGLFLKLSKVIESHARVFIGNSLPIREWDLAATSEDKGFECYSSRGLNGIDGQVSTFFGGLASDRKNWGVVGDLTALYDLQGPWILPQLREPQFRLIIINNSGGRIFDRIFKNPNFSNQHTLGFESWTKMWGLSYEKMTAINATSQAQVWEIVPDSESTMRFWNRYDEF